MTTDPLFPEIEPYETGMLPVDDLHTVYWEQSGNPQGVPVVHLHGGPGGGSDPKHRRYYDPKRFRIITFDQRGCGQSTPHAELQDNTTWHLVADIERLRAHLGLERWIVSGGSWGSTLGMAYGQTHPEACMGFLLRGIFMARRVEIDWWFEGCGTVFPDAWEDFANFVTPHERNDLLRAYYHRVTDPDPEVHLPAAVALRTYSARTHTFLPDEAHVAKMTDPAAALSLTRFFTAYCVQGAWLAPGGLLAGVERMRHLPAVILQGRYDMTTPMRSAWDLHKAWPEADFRIVTQANHSAGEPIMAKGVVDAFEALAAKLGV